MQDLYYHMGRLFDFDGKSIYKLQHGKITQPTPQIIEEEVVEYDFM